MKNSGAEKKERASISVSKATRDRFTSYLARLIGKRGVLLTQDDAINALLDVADKSEYDIYTGELRERIIRFGEDRDAIRDMPPDELFERYLEHLPPETQAEFARARELYRKYKEQERRER